MTCRCCGDYLGTVKPGVGVSFFCAPCVWLETLPRFPGQEEALKAKRAEYARRVREKRRRIKAEAPDRVAKKRTRKGAKRGDR